MTIKETAITVIEIIKLVRELYSSRFRSFQYGDIYTSTNRLLSLELKLKSDYIFLEYQNDPILRSGSGISGFSGTKLNGISRSSILLKNSNIECEYTRYSNSGIPDGFYLIDGYDELVLPSTEEEFGCKLFQLSTTNIDSTMLYNIELYWHIINTGFEFFDIPFRLFSPSSDYDYSTILDEVIKMREQMK